MKFYTKPLAIFIISFTFLLSCSNGNECGVDTYERIRKTDLKLDKRAEVALNEITNVLDGTARLYNKIEGSGTLAKMQETEIFFDLNEDNKSLNIETIFYKDLSGSIISHYFSVSMPIEQMDKNNIEVSTFDSHMYGIISDLSISSKFNNVDAFVVKTTSKNDDDEFEVTQCVKRSNYSFNLPNEEAQKLSNSLKIFLENFNN